MSNALFRFFRVNHCRKRWTKSNNGLDQVQHPPSPLVYVHEISLARHSNCTYTEGKCHQGVFCQMYVQQN